MSTVLAPPDLSWVTFTGDGQDRPCRYRRSCAAQATHVSVFRAACPHARWPICLTHRDLTLKTAEAGNHFYCGNCSGSPMTLLRIEPLQ